MTTLWDHAQPDDDRTPGDADAAPAERINKAADESGTASEPGGRRESAVSSECQKVTDSVTTPGLVVAKSETPSPPASDAIAEASSQSQDTADSLRSLAVPPDAQAPAPRRRFPRWPTRLTAPITPADGARRALIVAHAMVGVVSLALLALLYRVWQLETHPDPKIAQQVGSQKSRYSDPGRRGSVEDRKGRPFATSTVTHTLFVDPRLIDDPSTFAERLGRELDIDPVMVEEKIGPRSNSRYVLLSKQLDDARTEKFHQLSIHALGSQSRLVRDYPQGTLAGPLVGFATPDKFGIQHGVEGVEKMFDKDLTGQPGHFDYFRDTHHRALWVESSQYVPPTDGQTIRLSIDLTIQSFADETLAQTCEDFEAQSGELIVMDPATGEILAMANYPSVDPNKFGETKADMRRNRAITDTYEPGSTFKPFIFCFATQEGFARPDEWIDTGSSGMYVTNAGRRLHDAHASGRITWDEVLVHSSNIGMAIVGQRMGAEKLYDAVRAFGFGSPTRVGLPGEITGRVRPLHSWTTFSVTSVPMGQEISVTPLQITRAFCTFANGGYLVQPTMRMYDPRDRRTAPVFQRILAPETAAHTREVLRRVVNDPEGTGRKANSPMYDIFGKTGTAQVAGGAHGYIPDAYTASFICGAPLDNPRIVVGCVIHRPNRQKGHFGGTVAAPAARKVIEQTLVYMGVPPNPVPENDADAHSAQFARD